MLRLIGWSNQRRVATRRRSERRRKDVTVTVTRLAWPLGLEGDEPRAGGMTGGRDGGRGGRLKCRERKGHRCDQLVSLFLPAHPPTPAPLEAN